MVKADRGLELTHFSLFYTVAFSNLYGASSDTFPIRSEGPAEFDQDTSAPPYRQNEVMDDWARVYPKGSLVPNS